LFIAEFTRVRSLDITFKHLDHVPPIDLGPDEHVQWRIDDFRVEPAGDGQRITLWGLSATPRMTIVCGGVEIREMAVDVPNRLFPGWARPSMGFIRPRLGVLARGRPAPAPPMALNDLPPGDE
jgi:hypothetical protein